MARLDIFSDPDVAVKIWNPVTKTAIGQYETYSQAAKVLNVTERIVRGKCITKKQLFSPALQIDVAVRVVNANK